MGNAEAEAPADQQQRETLPLLGLKELRGEIVRATTKVKGQGPREEHGSREDARSKHLSLLPPLIIRPWLNPSKTQPTQKPGHCSPQMSQVGFT